MLNILPCIMSCLRRWNHRRQYAEPAVGINTVYNANNYQCSIIVRAVPLPQDPNQRDLGQGHVVACWCLPEPVALLGARAQHVVKRGLVAITGPTPDALNKDVNANMALWPSVA